MILKTVGELCEDLGCDYATGNAIIKLMVANGQATLNGQRPAKGGKGMPSKIYSLSETFTLSLIKKAA